MTLATPGDPARAPHSPTAGDLPQPIPWLGTAGPVPALDLAHRSSSRGL